jgi:hypothetical protein
MCTRRGKTSYGQAASNYDVCFYKVSLSFNVQSEIPASKFFGRLPRANSPLTVRVSFLADRDGHRLAMVIMVTVSYPILFNPDALGEDTVILWYVILGTQ